MLISDIIEHLKYGELANSGIVKNLNSEYPLEVIDAQKTIISFINLGLIEIFNRFQLKTSEELITLSENITLYTLLATDLNYILAIYDEGGNELPLNDEGNSLSIMTPSFNTLQVSNPNQDSILYVIYSSSPTKLEWTADLASNVPLPMSLIELLLQYINYRTQLTMSGKTQIDIRSYYDMFDTNCYKLLQAGSVYSTDSITSGRKLEYKGFI